MRIEEEQAEADWFADFLHEDPPETDLAAEEQAYWDAQLAKRESSCCD